MYEYEIQQARAAELLRRAAHERLAREAVRGRRAARREAARRTERAARAARETEADGDGASPGARPRTPRSARPA
ncbi:hypothetical protein [Streptomyces griseoruber]|uniref:Uncharacterized protein n=1 Tax=Streptomyces griseoruber TaxID=1943 RepID=A0A101SSU5_9ACTN|nr:hypothetical protein [Streptomyces griseoruber]KUN79550.1 hypothetical protein AQJ64_27790 [Streptomyces griseoruber]